MYIWTELSALLISTIMVCFVKNYMVNIVGIILLVLYSIRFLKKVYIVKKNNQIEKTRIPMFILQYVILYINIDIFTKKGFSIGQWIIDNSGILLGGLYILIISIVIILWVIITIIWVFRIPKKTSSLKSSIIIFGVISIVLITTTIYYANLFEDYNNYYSSVEINSDKGLYLSDGTRVKDKIDYLYFSSVIIFTIGYDEVSIVGSDLKIIVASEMFMSYLLMCIFVPSIFTLVSSKEE